jgi:uncharacterized cofD-like protein
MTTRVVALGGGHGLSTSLSALRRLPGVELTAVVSVADDGGSSGRLRAERNALPPGDLRQALAALAGEEPGCQQAAALFQHRFGGTGSLAGHPVGNVVLTALMERCGSPVAALDRAGAMLGTVGRVLPMSPRPVDIEATVRGADPSDPPGVTIVRGQVAVAMTSGRVVSVRLWPAAPEACQEAVEAVRRADWIVLGPGSWFTSVLPNLLVPDLAEAVQSSPARRIVTLNLSAEQAEVRGMSAADHLAALGRNAPALRVDAVLADPRVVDGDPHQGPDALRDAAQSLGGVLIVAPVAVPDGSPRHQPEALARVLGAIMAGGSGPRMRCEGIPDEAR